MLLEILLLYTVDAPANMLHNLIWSYTLQMTINHKALSC